MKKPLLIWVEQLTASGGTEVPQALLDQFQVQLCPSPDDLDHLVEARIPAAVFFDFDYPDRRRLGRFADAKEKYSSVPMVMLTLQHSESLAIWAYRRGALDYLIKPVDVTELGNCTGRILKIADLQRSQRDRVAKLFNSPIPSDVPNAPRSKTDRLSPAIHFVQQHYSDRIYSDAMARLCGMSPTHFSRAFKQTYDLTFQEFIVRYRVQQACRQFQGSRSSISDVAYNVGFTDPSYFTRVFKRYVGVAPSDFSAANDPGELTSADHGGADATLASSSQIVRKLSGSLPDG